VSYYTDGSTYKNGQEGQDSFYVVRCPNGEIISEHLGNFTINYAELSAIIKALEICELGATIKTDSKICRNWVNLPYKQTKKNSYLREKILYAQKLNHEKGVQIELITRCQNEAGKIIEQKNYSGNVESIIRADNNERVKVKTIAFVKDAWNAERELLECCLCHENDREKLVVEHLVLGAGMSGKEYSFCKKCWQSKTLGEDILRLIGFEGKMKLKDECLDIEVIGNNDKC